MHQYFSPNCRFFLLIIAGLFLMNAADARCQIYFWKDKSGVNHFTEMPPPEDGRLIKTFIEKKQPQRPPEQFPDEDSTNPKHSLFTVTHVFDGDSFVAEGFNIQIEVRLAGIDAPETGRNGRFGQPFSMRAKDFLKKWIENRTVGLKSYGMDPYNRQLAEVFVDGKNVALELISAGLAETYPGPTPEGFAMEPYRKAQERAKKAGLGIWSLGERYESPARWRRRMK